MKHFTLVMAAAVAIVAMLFRSQQSCVVQALPSGQRALPWQKDVDKAMRQRVELGQIDVHLFEKVFDELLEKIRHREEDAKVPTGIQLIHDRKFLETTQKALFAYDAHPVAASLVHQRLDLYRSLDEKVLNLRMVLRLYSVIEGYCDSIDQLVNNYDDSVGASAIKLVNRFFSQHARFFDPESRQFMATKMKRSTQKLERDLIRWALYQDLTYWEGRAQIRLNRVGMATVFSLHEIFPTMHRLLDLLEYDINSKHFKRHLNHRLIDESVDDVDGSLIPLVIDVFGISKDVSLAKLHEHLRLTFEGKITAVMENLISLCVDFRVKSQGKPYDFVVFTHVVLDTLIARYHILCKVLLFQSSRAEIVAYLNSKYAEEVVHLTDAKQFEKRRILCTQTHHGNSKSMVVTKSEHTQHLCSDNHSVQTFTQHYLDMALQVAQSILKHEDHASFRQFATKTLNSFFISQYAPFGELELKNIFQGLEMQDMERELIRFVLYQETIKWEQHLMNMVNVLFQIEDQTENGMKRWINTFNKMTNLIRDFSKWCSVQSLAKRYPHRALKESPDLLNGDECEAELNVFHTPRHLNVAHRCATILHQSVDVLGQCLKHFIVRFDAVLSTPLVESNDYEALANKFGRIDVFKESFLSQFIFSNAGPLLKNALGQLHRWQDERRRLLNFQYGRCVKTLSSKVSSDADSRQKMAELCRRKFHDSNIEIQKEPEVTELCRKIKESKSV